MIIKVKNIIIHVVQNATVKLKEKQKKNHMMVNIYSIYYLLIYSLGAPITNQTQYSVMGTKYAETSGVDLD